MAGLCAPESDDQAHFHSLLLIAPHPQLFWKNFTNSPEYQDQLADPLDRWSKRVIDRLAANLQGKAYYPFSGPPYWPFRQWALRTGQSFLSPVGLLVHRSYGLKISFRGAIALPYSALADRLWAEEASHTPAPSPCHTCDEKPCLNNCAVGALKAETYDYQSCLGELARQDKAAQTMRDQLPQQTCLQGCLVRKICPLNQAPDEDSLLSFTLQAFRRNHPIPSISPIPSSPLPSQP